MPRNDHMPAVLCHVKDWQIPWQWWRGDLYIAGFSKREPAVAYGQRNGWGVPT